MLNNLTKEQLIELLNDIRQIAMYNFRLMYGVGGQSMDLQTYHRGRAELGKEILGKINEFIK